LPVGKARATGQFLLCDEGKTTSVPTSRGGALSELFFGGSTSRERHPEQLSAGGAEQQPCRFDGELSDRSSRQSPRRPTVRVGTGVFLNRTNGQTSGVVRLSYEGPVPKRLRTANIRVHGPSLIRTTSYTVGLNGPSAQCKEVLWCSPLANYDWTCSRLLGEGELRVSSKRDSGEGWMLAFVYRHFETPAPQTANLLSANAAAAPLAAIAPHPP